MGWHWIITILLNYCKHIYKTQVRNKFCKCYRKRHCSLFSLQTIHVDTSFIDFMEKGRSTVDILIIVFVFWVNIISNSIIQWQPRRLWQDKEKSIVFFFYFSFQLWNVDNNNNNDNQTKYILINWKLRCFH